MDCALGLFDLVLLTSNAPGWSGMGLDEGELSLFAGVSGHPGALSFVGLWKHLISLETSGVND